MARSAHSLDVETRTARSSARFLVAHRLENMPDLVERAVESLPRYKIREATDYTATVSRSLTGKMWGNTLHLQYFFADAESTRVEVTTVPLLGTTVIDWGQSAQDIRRLHDALMLA